MNTVKEILVLERTETWQLSGKTGSGQRVLPPVSWFVGYLETKGNVYFFATNIEGSDGSGDKAREIAQNILQNLGLR
jgi:beta-lactamase class D